MIDWTEGSGEWVDVMHRYPSLSELTKLKVKVLIGGMQPKTIEKHVLAKPWHDGARFMVGDWQTVTHWYEIKTEHIK